MTWPHVWGTVRPPFVGMLCPGVREGVSSDWGWGQGAKVISWSQILNVSIPAEHRIAKDKKFN